ncbi:hypothetical protein BB558_001725 [Smittium angustum]|uniref:Uncharacterized protein n=1 Tax=Smittium angustum TaxID=133377 RepID=A0A2U1J0H0_SMIAN|nr:hypothetical protein BB558_005439 [Smittium angustum]PWA02132.1 hypothetical protein BB558_001725 [Smittium angustum]
MKICGTKFMLLFLSVFLRWSYAEEKMIEGMLFQYKAFSKSSYLVLKLDGNTIHSDWVSTELFERECRMATDPDCLVVGKSKNLSIYFNKDIFYFIIDDFETIDYKWDKKHIVGCDSSTGVYNCELFVAKFSNTYISRIIE